MRGLELLTRRLLPSLLTLCLSMAALGTDRTDRAGSIASATSTQDDLAAFVNPFIGTSGGGATFPGADVPFGMVQWSPDTNDGPGGYYYGDPTIKGFSLTHLSGAGCGYYRDFPFMPISGDVFVSPGAERSAYTSSFSHANEQASAGYYGVRLDSGIKVELSTTTRSGIGRFTYPAGGAASLLINANANYRTGTLQIRGNDEVAGASTSGGFCGPNGHYTVYFVAQFSQPFTGYGTWNGATMSRGSTTSSGPQSGAYVSFDTTRTPVVLVKVGVSFTSLDNARANLQTEDSASPPTATDFDTIRTAASTRWNSMLNRITVGGGATTDRQTFYTALYHSLLFPSVFSDINGQYTGFDGQVHTTVYTDTTTGATVPYTQYANYSNWDIYRTEMPLLALLAPAETSDMMQSLVVDAQQNGRLPIWALANSDSYVMIGDPAAPTIAAAYAFGARHFDARAALNSMLNSVSQRPGEGAYQSLGYTPRLGAGVYAPASTTLEYATADFSIAQVAQALGDGATYRAFMSRAQNWQNIFNPTTAYIEPRMMDGTFVSPFDPANEDSFIEGNGAQYSWMVPYNLHALFDAMGGQTRVAAKLDAFFTQLNAGPDAAYAWLGNEPSFEAPWEYDFGGEPWRTQAVVRQAITTLFAPTPDGLPGNDDLGAMSTWYVWGALGLYPEIPGVGGLVVGSPLFPQVTLHLTDGDVTIAAFGAANAMPYVHDLTVNGQQYTKLWLPLSGLTNGAILRFTLGSTPNMAWGSDPTDAPPSFADGEAPTIGFSSSNDGHGLTVAAGSSQTFQLGVRNLTDTPLTVQWTANVPAGLHLQPASSALSLTGTNSGDQTLTVSVSPGALPGTYLVPIQLQSLDQQAVTHTLPSVVVAVSVMTPAASPTQTASPTVPTGTTPTATPIPPIATAAPSSAPSTAAVTPGPLTETATPPSQPGLSTTTPVPAPSTAMTTPTTLPLAATTMLSSPAPVTAIPVPTSIAPTETPPSPASDPVPTTATSTPQPPPYVSQPLPAASALTLRPPSPTIAASLPTRTAADPTRARATNARLHTHPSSTRKRAAGKGKTIAALALKVHLIRATIYRGGTGVVLVQTSSNATVSAIVTTTRGHHETHVVLAVKKGKYGQWRVLVSVGLQTVARQERIAVMARWHGYYARTMCTFTIIPATLPNPRRRSHPRLLLPHQHRTHRLPV